MNPNIIFLTGNFAAGKTTISRIIEDKFHYTRISGDDISLSLYPGEGIILNEDKRNKYQIILKELFLEVEKHFHTGKNLIIDYVIFYDEIEKYRKKYGNHIQFFVLLPNLKSALERNFERTEYFENDNSRMERIQEIFNRDKHLIGQQFYIDTAVEPIEGTIEIINEQVNLTEKG